MIQATGTESKIFKPSFSTIPKILKSATIKLHDKVIHLSTNFFPLLADNDHNDDMRQLVTITVNEEAITTANEPSLDLPEEDESLELRNSRSSRHHGRKRPNDKDLYGESDAPPFTGMGKEHFLAQRERLLNLQIKHMEIRLQEAEERREEANLRKEIARRKLEKLQCSFLSSIVLV